MSAPASVYTRISPTDETAIEHLPRSIIRASFSQARMQYLARF